MEKDVSEFELIKPMALC